MRFLLLDDETMTSSSPLPGVMLLRLSLCTVVVKLLQVITFFCCLEVMSGAAFEYIFISMLALLALGSRTHLGACYSRIFLASV